MGINNFFNMTSASQWFSSVPVLAKQPKKLQILVHSLLILVSNLVLLPMKQIFAELGKNDNLWSNIDFRILSPKAYDYLELYIRMMAKGDGWKLQLHSWALKVLARTTINNGHLWNCNIKLVSLSGATMPSKSQVPVSCPRCICYGFIFCKICWNTITHGSTYWKES